ncbi:hypothetical protein NQ315_000818 [Exocentrus adspersus]|uniref:Uncharacterized protein n=1 Tax=Exocentrus adspersus TaxID=1586481 RepID=A0AAV8WEM2_9CUCU|nr:hypothetical protein NQ315_000818 [Exocentrus adspersus]
MLLLTPVDTTNTNSCELDDQDEDNDGANNTLCAEDVVVECAGTPQSHQKIVKIRVFKLKNDKLKKHCGAFNSRICKTTATFNDRLLLSRGQLTEDITKKWAYLKKIQETKSILQNCKEWMQLRRSCHNNWENSMAKRFLRGIGLSPPLTSSSSSSTSKQYPLSHHYQRNVRSPRDKMIDGLIMQEMQKSHMDSTDHFCKMLCLEMKKLSARNKRLADKIFRVVK